MEQEQRESGTRPEQKNGNKSYFGYNLHSINGKGSCANQNIQKNDFITYDSQVNISEKNEVVYKIKDTLEQNQQKLSSVKINIKKFKLSNT